MHEVPEAASAKGMQLSILRASTEGEIDAAFAMLVQLHAGALVVEPDPFFGSRREQLAVLASRDAVPAIYFEREFTAVGGLYVSWSQARDRVDGGDPTARLDAMRLKLTAP